MFNLERMEFWGVGAPDGRNNVSDICTRFFRKIVSGFSLWLSLAAQPKLAGLFLRKTLGSKPAPFWPTWTASPCLLDVQKTVVISSC